MVFCSRCLAFEMCTCWLVGWCGKHISAFCRCYLTLWECVSKAQRIDCNVTTCIEHKITSWYECCVSVMELECNLVTSKYNKKNYCCSLLVKIIIITIMSIALKRRIDSSAFTFLLLYFLINSEGKAILCWNLKWMLQLLASCAECSLLTAHDNRNHNHNNKMMRVSAVHVKLVA